MGDDVIAAQFSILSSSLVVSMVFFVKQKTAYEMRISDWSSDVCSSDLQGCTVIDNSSLYRMDPDVPLIVPEVNPEAIDGYKAKNIIANPNCSTAQMVVALKPLHDAAGIKRVVVSTYQSVSGAGKEGMDELFEQ